MNFEKSLWVLVVLLIVGAVACLIKILHLHFFEKRKAKFEKEILQSAKYFCNSFYVNSCEKVTAICTRGDFERTLNDYQNEIASGNRSKFDRVVLQVKPTFTFAEHEGVQRPIHTGSRNDLKKIAEYFIFQAIGVRREEVSVATYEEIGRIMGCRDRRLFVPYSSNTPKLEEQYKFYGESNLLEARKVLVLE